ncbi:Uncharacterized protein TCM_035932 [Theobroma cacao]|uniref:Uncharacterized protein n=1 Tax=Theobroma cacao TaxID=3641 RepID=A0A061FJQ1_THECC|nr:Uncharacterized protein TCM_035932 [Theobroma cacao]
MFENPKRYLSRVGNRNNQLVDLLPRNNIREAPLHRIPTAMAVSTMLADIGEIMWSQPHISTRGLATYIIPWPCHVHISRTVA